MADGSAIRTAHPVLVVVSHYNAWAPDQLVALLDQMATVAAGAAFDVCVVVNRAEPKDLILPDRHAGVRVLHRENTGYNVGAWEHGWREDVDHRLFLFLQEECRIVRPGWLGAFVRLAARPGVGLVGESLHWGGLSWEGVVAQYRGHAFWGDGDETEVSAAVRAGLRRLGVPEGRTGAHLQSLVLCARRDVLEAVGGFALGDGYGDATIGEIAMSKKVEALGLTVREVGPGSFRYILHPQWRGRQGVLRWLLRGVAARLPAGLKARLRRLR